MNFIRGNILSDSKFIIQKKISLILATCGFLSIIIHVYSGVMNSNSMNEIITNPRIVIVAIFLIILLLTHNIDKRLVRVIHGGLFFSNAFISIYYQYNSFYGLGLYILGILVLYRYKYFKNYPTIKIITLLLILFFSIRFSSSINSQDFLFLSLSLVIFVTFFLLIIYVLYKDVINDILFLEIKSQSSIDNMITERNEALENMELLKDKISYLESDIINAKFSPKRIEEYGFTVKELEIVELLCKEKLTNQQLCDKLFISLGTIKQHLNHIFSKCGVKNRVSVIYIFQDHFKLS